MVAQSRAVVFVLLDRIEYDPKCRASVEAAAARWGFDVVLHRGAIVEGVHPYWQKAFVCDTLKARYDVVLQLDHDIMINAEAPSPLDHWDDRGIGVVRDIHWDLWNQAEKRRVKDMWAFQSSCVSRWAKVTGLPRVGQGLYANGGLLLYRTDTHSECMREWQEFGRKGGLSMRFLPEQTVLSLLIKARRVPAYYMAPTWNLRPAGRIASLTGERMVGWCYHFSGKAKCGRVSRVNWELPADQSVLSVGQRKYIEVPHGLSL